MARGYGGGRSPIGRPGRAIGSGKSRMTGSFSGPGNLGKRTDVRKFGSQNHDPATAFRRRGINAGPGGTQIV
jgi:hypothetical protein